MSYKVTGIGFIDKTQFQEKIVQMAIIEVGIEEFPEKCSSNLLDALIDAMYAVEDKDDPVPIFDKYELVPSRRQPYVRVTCVNEYSRLWLIDAVKKLSPFEERSLLAVEEAMVGEMRWNLGHMYVRDSVMPNIDYDNILERIKKSALSVKTELKTELWKIDSIYKVDGGTLVYLVIDAASILLIEKLKYAVRIGMGSGYIWDGLNDRGHPEAEKFSITNQIILNKSSK